MARRLFLFCCLQLIALSAFAEQMFVMPGMAPAAFPASEKRDDSDRRFFDILLLANRANAIDGRMVYDSLKKDDEIPFAANLLLGFGIGSFIQGDTSSAAVMFATDILALALLVAGYQLYDIQPMRRVTIYSGRRQWETYQEPVNNNYATFGSICHVIAGFVFLVSRIFQCVRPFNYARDYNEGLKMAVYRSSQSTNVSFDLQPSFDSYGNPNGLSLLSKVPL